MKKKYPFLKTLNRACKESLKMDRLLILIFFGYTFFASIFPLFSVYLPKFLIKEIISDNPSTEYILKVTIIFAALMLVFGFFEQFLNSQSTVRIMIIRIDFLSKLFRRLSLVDYKHTEDPNYLDAHEDVLESCTGGNRGFEVLLKILFTIFSKIVTIFLYIIIVGRLSFVVLLAVFLSVFVTAATTLLAKKFRYSKKEQLSHANRKIGYYQQITHDFSYGKDIRLFNLQDKIKTNYSNEIKSYISVFRKIKNKEYSLAFIDLLFVLIADAFLYYILITKVINGMSIDDFSMYLIAALSLSTLIKTTALDFTTIIAEGQYVNDYFEYMDEIKVDENDKLKKIDNDTLEITFENVSFKYPNTDKWIFENLNLKINKKEKLAIVGINGAGKTTLIKLILRLFEPSSGRILVNDIEISKFDIEEYHRMFSVVFQEINILAYTIRENITLGLSSDDERIWNCLSRVGLKEKVEKLENKLDHMMLRVIDENGVVFSGGENQKLAIARALYKNGNVVILDEPTAALDALAESEIYQNFNDLVTDKTAIYVSHRLASTKFCDKIALFKDSKLIEYGSHDELMELKQEYYSMFVVQGKYYQGEKE